MTIRASEPRAGPFAYDPPPFDITVRTEDPSAWVIELQGELDLATGPMLKNHLEPYRDPSGSNGHRRRVIYLLPGLEFIDASGLHALLDAVGGHDPATITIREPSSLVRRLLELVGLDAMIEDGTHQ